MHSFSQCTNEFGEDGQVLLPLELFGEQGACISVIQLTSLKLYRLGGLET